MKAKTKRREEKYKEGKKFSASSYLFFNLDSTLDKELKKESKKRHLRGAGGPTTSSFRGEETCFPLGERYA